MRRILTSLSLVASSFLLLAGRAEVTAQEPTPAQELIAAERALVVGHRGAAAHAPENTIISFMLALEAGADVVELDYFESSDGVPVCFHDDRLDRTTNAADVFGARRAREPISSFKLDELRQLDAGEWYDNDYRGTGIPTLEEALDAIQPHATTFIEHKGGEAQTLIDLLTEKDMLDSVVVLSFYWDFIAECHRLAPQLTVGCLGKDTLTQRKLDSIASSGASLVGWKAADLREADIALLHEHEMQVWSYTVNDERTAERLLAAEIDGLISDDPQWLRELISEE